MRCHFTQLHLKGISGTLLVCKALRSQGSGEKKKSTVEDYRINNSPLLMAVTSLGDTVTRGQLLATKGY
jgi:hypothetical protein